MKAFSVYRIIFLCLLELFSKKRLSKRFQKAQGIGLFERIYFGNANIILITAITLSISLIGNRSFSETSRSHGISFPITIQEPAGISRQSEPAQNKPSFC